MPPALARHAVRPSSSSALRKVHVFSSVGLIMGVRYVCESPTRLSLHVEQTISKRTIAARPSNRSDIVLLFGLVCSCVCTWCSRCIHVPVSASFFMEGRALLTLARTATVHSHVAQHHYYLVVEHHTMLFLQLHRESKIECACRVGGRAHSRKCWVELYNVGTLHPSPGRWKVVSFTP